MAHMQKERQGCKRSAGSCDVGETLAVKTEGRLDKMQPDHFARPASPGSLVYVKNMAKRSGSMRQDMHETVQTTVELELN